MGEEWDDSTQTKEQIEASIVSKQEATIRRERAMAYAFSHQWKNSSRTANPMFIDPSNPQWGWSWLERWMAAKPWENRGTEKDPKDTNSVKSSATATVTPIPVLGEGEITKSDGKLLIPDGKLLRNKRSHQLLPGATHFRRIMAPMTSDPLSGFTIGEKAELEEQIRIQYRKKFH